MKRTTKRVLISAGGLLLVLAVLGGIKFSQINAMMKAGESFQPPPETVTTTTVAADVWQKMTNAIGTVASFQGVLLSTEVPGTVQEITFSSGDTVKRGQILVKLDTSIERAQLASAVADARLAETTLTRTQSLFSQGAAAQAELDIARAQALRSSALARGLRATIDKKTIRAPFSGQVGIRQINPGQVMSAGAPIVSLEALDPLFVDFSLPQSTLGRIAVGQAVEAMSDAFPGHAWSGRIAVIDPRLDANTRNAKVRAQIPNSEGLLKPGMFTKVQVLQPEVTEVIAVPATAVLYAPYGNSVFLVEEQADKKTGRRMLIARQQFVRLGEKRGDFVAVLSGLKPGQVVVSTGAFKLRNGMSIVVNNRLQPEFSADPRPSET